MLSVVLQSLIHLNRRCPKFLMGCLFVGILGYQVLAQATAEQSEFAIHILRIQQTPNAILGEMYVNGVLTAHTLELPWRDNMPSASSIPEGEYGAILRYDKSRDGFFTIQLTGTGPRTGIQIHVGNKPDDITGCILLGMAVNYKNSLLKDSKVAIRALKRLFYSSDDPVMTPNKNITVKISFLPSAMRIYPGGKTTGSYYVFDSPNWYPRDTEYTNFYYEEYFRDTSHVVVIGRGGPFNGLYARWGILGNTPFQVSEDLKRWKTYGSGEMVLRVPLYNPQPSFSIMSREVIEFSDEEGLSVTPNTDCTDDEECEYDSDDDYSSYGDDVWFNGYEYEQPP